MTRALIALGSNLGDREARLREGLSGLRSEARIEVLRVSSIYETEPVGGPPQGLFLNACTLLETSLDPQDLMERLLVLEARAGRVRREPLGPRTLDLDLLLFGARVLDEPGLVVPHPRMTERAFVMLPAAEIAAGMAHPLLGITLGDLARRLSGASGVRRVKEGEAWT